MALICASGAKALDRAMRTKFYKQNLYKMKSLKIGDLLARIPIIQGGMGVGVSLSGLASAVANEGGVGVISSAGLGVIYKEHSSNYNEASIWGLKEELRKAREASRGIIGVNVMVAMSNFADMVKTAIAEKADIIFSGAGLPLNLPSFLTEGAKTKLAPIVSSARAAKLLCEKWLANYNYIPDAIVVEGPKAGGHLGFKHEQINDQQYALESVLPEVVKEVREFGEQHDVYIPVIAAGGIYTGEDIYRTMQLGADGVQMGNTLRNHRGVRCRACIQADIFGRPRGGYRDHSESGRYAWARHSRHLSRNGARGAETPEGLPIQLHQNVRCNSLALLHYARALQRLQRTFGARLRLLRSKCVAIEQDPERTRVNLFVV